MNDPAWPLIASWLAEASNDAAVLPGTREDGEAALLRLQLTPQSTLGAVALETGGILVDRGWLRILGSGSARLRATLLTWNAVGDPPEIEPLQDALLVAFDAVGGFFAVNGGEFEGERGHVFYFAPDSLEWQSLGGGYSDFLHWALTGDLDAFYADLRWPGWHDELGDASGDVGFSLYPPPFTKEGRPVAAASRRLVPMSELWGVQREYARQLAG